MSLTSGMGDRRRRSVSLLIAGLSAAAIAGCSPNPRVAAQRSVASGEAQRAVQAMLDARASPQCANLLGPRDPIVVDADFEHLASVRALVAADLIAPTDQTTRFGRIYQPTPAGRAFIRHVDMGQGLHVVQLCYARRRVVKVWLKPADGKTDPLTELGYAYTLVDTPPWTRNRDMQAAFPFLNKALAMTFVGPDLIVYEKGRWSSNLLITELPPGAGLKESFFFGKS